MCAVVLRSLTGGRLRLSFHHLWSCFVRVSVCGGGSATVRVSMAAATAVRVRMPGEEEEAEDVDEETNGADDEQQVRIVDLFRLRDALESLDEDGEAERYEEDRVDERPHHLGSRPTVRVLGGVPLGNLQAISSTISTGALG